MLKKIFISIWTLVLVCSMNMFSASAASYGISASTSRVSPGGRFTVSVGGSVIGRFNISVSNGSASSSSVWVENGYQSISITAGSSGTVTVVATPAVGLSDTNGDPVSVSSRSTSVSIVSPSSSSSSKSNSSKSSSSSHSSSSSSSSNSSSSSSRNNDDSSEKKEEEKKSKNNDLSSLTINNGTLSPSFSKDKTSYKVSLPAETTEVEINAKADDSKAEVSGTGKKSVEAGKNNFNITCKSESGSEKIYSIQVIVDDKPLVYVEHNGKKLGVVRNFEEVDAPEGFSETKVKIEGKETKAWTNKDLNKTIVSLLDGDAKHFYLYEDGKIGSIFQYVGVKGIDLYILEAPEGQQDREGMKYTQIEIEGENVYAWTFNNKEFKNFALVYAMDNEGKENYYQYETTMKTIQLYSNAAPVTEKKYNQITSQSRTYMIVMIIFIILTLGLAAFIGTYYYKFIYMKKKVNSNEKVLDDSNVEEPSVDVEEDNHIDEATEEHSEEESNDEVVEETTEESSEENDEETKENNLENENNEEVVEENQEVADNSEESNDKTEESHVDDSNNQE